MQHNTAKALRKALALVTVAAFAAMPGAFAATPEPLPPPPELLGDGNPLNLQYGQPYGHQYPTQPTYPSVNHGGLGYSPVPNRTPQPQAAQQQDVYDPYNTPVSTYLPPLPGHPAAEVGNPYATQSPWPSNPQASGFSIPDLDPPPMAGIPPAPDRLQNRPPMVISPPQNMPDEYFNLPFPLAEAANIPGVLLPELNEEFHDPGMGQIERRPIRIGMSPRQLQPFFELAKGFEKNALDAKAQNDLNRHRQDLRKAVEGYMEIIAMADAGHEAREEAWYGVARCEYRLENWWKAFDAIERSFPGKFEKAEVEGRIKLEMFIAERLWRIGHDPVSDARTPDGPMTGYQAASKVYAAAVFNQPQAKEAPLAILRRGDAAAMDGNWKDAAKFYRTVVQYYPESEPAMQARSSLAEAVHRQEWPAGFPEAARQDLASVMTEVEGTQRKLSGPAEERRQRAVTLANTHEAETKLRQAKDYMQRIRVKKSRDAAVFQLGEIVSHYPNTPQAREAADLLMEMGIEPPMILSEGNRYPIPSGGATMLERVANQAGTPNQIGGPAGGSVELRGQSDRRDEAARRRRRVNAPVPERSGPQPRQGNFSPAPELAAQIPPQTAWPSPRITVPPRQGYAGQPQYDMQPGMPPQGAYPPAYGQNFQQGLPPGYRQGGFSPAPGFGQTVPDGYGQWAQDPYAPGGPYYTPPGFSAVETARPPVRVETRPETIQVPGIAPEWD